MKYGPTQPARPPPPAFLATIVHQLPHIELIIECVYSPQIVNFMMGEAVRGKIQGGEDGCLRFILW